MHLALNKRFSLAAANVFSCFFYQLHLAAGAAHELLEQFSVLSVDWENLLGTHLSNCRLKLQWHHVP